ncbi:MAG: integral rane protein [Mycobacterium sp.]|jgi:putative tricarboxylic transport membrane protein|nr:integral rane protein [Mycobacterium sp.]
MTLLRVRRPSEFVVVAVVSALGLLVLWDTLTAPAQAMDRGPLGPHVLPVVVGSMLLVCAAGIGIDLLRGGQGQPEDGEAGERSDWITWSVILGAIVLVALAVEPLGWVIAGGAMFYLCVYAFGSRAYVRDAIVSVALAFGSFYFFFSVLGINLSPGILKGIL